MGRTAEAAEDARRSLVVARELGYPAGEAKALAALSIACRFSGDFNGAVQLARQAVQIPGDVPGWIYRANLRVLTFALFLAGDLAAAERSCTAGLTRARDADDLQYQASMLTLMVNLDLQEGRLEDAAEHLRESLHTAARAGGLIDVLNDLECCGHLCVATERHAEAVTVWTACDALKRQEGFTDPSWEVRRRDEALARARQVLGEARARAAEDRGAAMSPATATEYALMLTAPDPQPKPPGGLAGLSARERELVTLVARGRTDAQIAGQLAISIRTVRSHLDRIRDKTGCRRRADLTRLALTTGLV